MSEIRKLLELEHLTIYIICVYIYLCMFNALYYLKVRVTLVSVLLHTLRSYIQYIICIFLLVSVCGMYTYICTYVHLFAE